MPKSKIGGISTRQLRDFVKASYKKKEDAPEVDGYKLDNELSTKRSKVYVNAKGEAVVAHAGTDSATDWANNLLAPIPYLYKKTSRYKDAKAVQEKALKKYGKDKLTTTGHSQSGLIVNELNKEGLTGKEADVLNPAILNPFEKHKGIKVVRSKRDPVSFLTRKNKKDITIEGNSFNPITEHQPDILNRIDNIELGGRYIIPINHNLMHY